MRLCGNMQILMQLSRQVPFKETRLFGHRIRWKISRLGSTCGGHRKTVGGWGNLWMTRGNARGGLQPIEAWRHIT